jgi:hypothetical protein
LFNGNNSRLRARLAALFALPSITAQAFADPKEIAELSWQAQQLVEGGKTEEAIPIAERVAQLTKTRALAISSFRA